ncbi:hypothetical protein ONS95_012708 [Cadophora gregata]|uniref:uncharacterized protein n=1 Tax=Cadophora gregata TaxID=51156 RepID=UPI0026DB0EB7|nr:uncharacterized protein ONS95_012708 [Cadophora gregata]KAK0118421.1 hypothetical protein ONS95_012708 [Cadophora gregata]KAK0123488.1 hypothetical protein ONS96_010471 [Cadophora gregata f. sp. sojae]
MAVLKPTPTATVPAPPTCTIIAKNEVYHTYVSERWSYCAIKQTYNPLGANYTLSTDPGYLTPSPAPTAVNDKPNNENNNNTAYIALAILGALLLGFSAYIITSWTTRCIENCKRRRRDDTQNATHPPPRRGGTVIREARAWFGRQHNSLLNRVRPHEDRSLESVVRRSPLQRGLHRLRTFGKSMPPSVSPVGHAALGQGQGRNPRPRNEPPPPGYHDRYQDVLYFSETESESERDVDVDVDVEIEVHLNGDGDVNELSVLNDPWLAEFMSRDRDE